MIARSHICLSCQFRLARRVTASRKGVAFQSTDANPPRLRVSSDDVEKDVNGEDLFHHTKRPLRLSRRPLAGKSNLSEYPLGKLYGYTGQQLREARERLSIDVLGEAAEVIVLRDSKISKYQKPIEENAETPEGIDILAKLDEERGLVGWEEVESNINDLKPDERHRTTSEFDRLLMKLQNGFTAAQLARYLRANATDDETLTLSPSSPIQRITPWFPGISVSDEFLDQGRLRSYDRESYTSKQRLALRILIECWRLTLSSIEQGVGQIEIEFKPEDLAFLLNDNSSSLRKILSDHIVNREDRVESFRSNDAQQTRNAIRITSTQTKCHTIIMDIERTLESIHRIQFSMVNMMHGPKEGEKPDFQKWMNAHFDNAVIEELERLTLLDIQKSSSGLLTVSSTEELDDQGMTKSMHIAQQLLLTASQSSPRYKGWLGCKEVPKFAEGVMGQYSMIEGLRWYEKVRQWARWTLPILKSAEKQDVILPDVDMEETPAEPRQIATSMSDDSNVNRLQAASYADVLESPSKSLKNDGRSFDHRSGWVREEDFAVESSAILGSVIHDLSSTSTELQGEVGIFDASVRSFSTFVPNISRTLSSAKVSPPLIATQIAVMRFLPNVFVLKADKRSIDSEVFAAFPPIEMRFSISEVTNDMDLISVRAIVSNENSDLMLPGSPTDIRFQQRSTANYNLNPDELAPSWMEEFIKKSNLTLQMKEQLVVSPSLRIPISSHLCETPGLVTSGPDVKDAQVQDVDYLFAGLEVHQVLSLDFEGWRLLYASIDPGLDGGIRGELSLHPIRVRDDDVSIYSEQAFLESAFKLADESLSAAEIRQMMEIPVKMAPSAGLNAKLLQRSSEFFTKRPM